MIKLLVLDVDGTMTDGGLYIDCQGNELKKFYAPDGLGITHFQKCGGDVAIISARFSEATVRRATDLNIHIAQNGKGNKLQTLQALCQERGLKAEQVCYMGDDVNDIEAAQWAGIGVAVGNAHPFLKLAADWVTEAKGGEGAVREVTDRLIASRLVEGQ